MMTRDELARRLRNACAEVTAAEDELTAIDARFGDADHGLTMHKIAAAIDEAATAADGSVKDLFDDAAMAVMALNGGSAVPLWNTWLDGLQEAAPDEDAVDVDGLKAMFAHAYAEFSDISGAHVGDKTMMDALAPASEAIAAVQGEEAALFNVAAKAALDGAEASRGFVAKFGRAKSYGEETIGTPDAGAVSMARFFQGLAKA